MGTTVNIVCFTSKRLSNGEHPLMLRICKDRTVKYKSLGISLNPIYWDFDKKMPKTNCPHRELIEKIIIDKKHAYLEQILMFKAMNRDFTASTLVEKVENPVRIKTVEESFKSQIESLKEEGRIGNMNVVKDLYVSIKKFTKDLHIYYWEIDAVWLRNYEVFLRKKDLLIIP